MKTYDAIVVGGGVAGGIVACTLAEAGKHVLLLERGKAMRFEDIPRDHLRNHRLSVYGHNTGPELEGNPRTWQDSNGKIHITLPYHSSYQNNAMVLGGGGRVYGAQAWRYMPQDFRMASTYGVPEGSSLADWPISYDDMELWYERAEREIGVSGDDHANRFQGPRRKGYPMPPLPDNRSRKVMQEAAEKLGWNTVPIPLAINSVPYQGRPACIQCQHCVGFACPNDSKNGSHNTVTPRALATGNCELITEAQAERIETDAQGKATGVTYITMQNGQAVRETAQASAIIVSSGAIESSRLLLLSSGKLHPNGLGNDHDLVGRNLQGHYYPGAHGLLPEPIYDGIGPGASLATCQFNHGNPGIVGGGMIANDFIKLPLILQKWGMPADVPRWGIENKQWMRENYSRVLQITGPVHDIPSPDARVTLDDSVRDKYGLPVVRFSGTTHPETVKTAHFMWERVREWLTACGAEKIWGDAPGLFLSGGQHQAGTCRMGTDPTNSVTDIWGRVHGQDNLFVVDGSLHVTNGGFNPMLTIMAMAFRCSDHIARQI